MNKIWTGRVVKDSSERIDFGSKENEQLLLDYYPPLTAIVEEEDEGKTVRDVLIRQFQVSNKLLAEARQSEFGLTINEERVYVSAPVQKGEIVRLRMEREQSETIEPESIPLSIIYEDDSLLVVNKPPNLVVHPTHGHYTGTLANGVVHHWRVKGERYRFRPIHRLDEDTSGIVVIAKNGYVHQQLSELMQEGDMDKRYLALVHGHVEETLKFIEGAIARHPETPHLRTIREDGQYAKTGVTCLQHLAYVAEGVKQPICLSLIELKLYTGRTHQIRVHMHASGHPLLGDKFYYSTKYDMQEAALAFPRQALHAYQLTLIHPMTKEMLTFKAPLPDDMNQILVLTKVE